MYMPTSIEAVTDTVAGQYKLSIWDNNCQALVSDHKYGVDGRGSNVGLHA